MTLKTEKVLKWLVVITLASLGIFGTYAARGLYADGSFWLFEMLQRDGFFIFDPHRAHAQFLVQFPIALAIWLNVTDLNVLIRVHSFGFIGIPLLFWLGALAVQWGSQFFWLFVMALSVTFLRTNFFAAGEFSTTYGLTAFCAAILLQTRLQLFQAILLMLSAVALIYSYEATLLLGLILAGFSIAYLVKNPAESFAVKSFVTVATMAFVASVYVGARSVFYLRAYDASSTANLSALKEYHFLYLIVAPLLIALLFTKFTIKLQKYIFLLFLTVALMYVCYVLKWDHSNISFGYLSYAYRALSAPLLIMILLILFIFYYSPIDFKYETVTLPSSYISSASIIFFLTMLVPLFFHTFGYYKWAQRFENSAINITTHTPFDKAQISDNQGWTSGYNWMWGNPSTSILLRGNAKAVVLNHSAYQGYEPINLNTLDASPLSRYIKTSPMFP